MKFFEFSQNNSGGSFEVNDKLCYRLFIEADSRKDAIYMAEEMGVYFNGVDDGIDCPCCGNRWYTPDDIKFPLKYSEKKEFHNIEEYAQHLADHYGWTSPDARIFYKDGTVKEIFINKKK